MARCHHDDVVEEVLLLLVLSVDMVIEFYERVVFVSREGDTQVLEK